MRVLAPTGDNRGVSDASTPQGKIPERKLDCPEPHQQSLSLQSIWVSESVPTEVLTSRGDRFEFE